MTHEEERESRIVAHMRRVEREEAELKNSGLMNAQGKNLVRDEEVDIDKILCLMRDGAKTVRELVEATTISEKVIRRYLKFSGRFACQGTGKKHDPWRFRSA